MARITLGNVGEIMQRSFFKALFVEFICTYLFAFAAVGSAMANEKLNGNSLVGLLYQAVAQALVVSGIVSAGLHISGGHINPAVTFSLTVGGHCTIIRSLLYWLDQLTASTLACYSLKYMTGGLAVPVHQLASGVGYTQGLLMESVLTFSLLFTVYGTMVDPKSGAAIGLGPLLVGLVVGANTLAGGAFTGASMNPARSFGPAFVNWDWTEHWVYWVGPLCGGGLSGYIYENFFMTVPVQQPSGVTLGQGLLMEAVLTFSLLFTVYGTMIDPKTGVPSGLGPFLVALVVGANTLAGGAFSGASMNPARSFGPAFVNWNWTDHWIYWVGPLTGGGLSGFIFENFLIVRPPVEHVLLAHDDEIY